MKTFKNIEFKPCNDVDGVRGQIEINGQVVSIISGVRTQSIGSRLVKNHWSFEVAVWETTHRNGRQRNGFVMHKAFNPNQADMNVAKSRY